MTSINERAERIFKNLISDPYWQGSQGKSREEVVRQEAQQRARQAHNNDLALSMAVSKSGAVKSLMQFLQKAEELDVSEEALHSWASIFHFQKCFTEFCFCCKLTLGYSCKMHMVTNAALRRKACVGRVSTWNLSDFSSEKRSPYVPE